MRAAHPTVVAWLLPVALVAAAPSAAARPARPLASQAEQEEEVEFLHCAYAAHLTGSQPLEPGDWNASRYELGLRLRAFDAAFAEADAGARERAIAPLKAAVEGYFRGDPGAAARALDDARRALTGDGPDVAWAGSLRIEPTTRCLEPGARTLRLQVDALYAADDLERPAGELRLEAELVAQDGTVLGSGAGALDDLPTKIVVEGTVAPLPETDATLRARVLSGERVLLRQAQTISVVRDARERLDAAAAVARARSGAPTLEAASVLGIFRTLRAVCEGGSVETDLPVARLVAEAEAMAASLERGEPWTGVARAGDHWLRLPVGSRLVAVRVRVPAGLEDGAPRPLVVALHGAGGSENMYFDAYGAGLAPRLAAERGWILVSPRADFLAPPPVAELVDALAERLPIDRARVALLGHSMGAMQGMAAIGAHPERFAAAALLSGGAAPRRSEALTALPLWLGAGEEDFGLPMTQRLAELLAEAGAARVELHVVPRTEHLGVVQAALPEVFAFLDRALDAQPRSSRSTTTGR